MTPWQAFMLPWERIALRQWQQRHAAQRAAALSDWWRYESWMP